MNNKKYKYFIFGFGSYYESMFSTKHNDSYLYWHDELQRKLNKHELLNRIYSRFMSNKKCRYFYKKFIKKRLFFLEYEPQRVSCECPVFVFLQMNKLAHDYDFIEYLKKKHPNAKFGIWLTNILETCDENIDVLKKHFDIIITISKLDAKNHSLFYHRLCYQSPDNYLEKEPLYDVYFCGRDKGRKGLIEDIYIYLKKNGLKCKFVLCVNTIEELNTVAGIEYITKPIDYLEIMESIKLSRCVLEIVPGREDDSTTLRLLEAIVYSKKLLTNSKILQNNPMYNAHQIQCFSDVTQIDLNWITNKDKDSFIDPEVVSPKHFFDEIDSIFTTVKRS